MKSIINKLALCLLLGTTVGAHAAPALFPNGNFETPAGASWAEVSGGITYSYPTSGGNPNGYGVMDAQNGQWAIWVSNGNVPLSLGSLGLTAGQTYNFSLDMKTLAGTNIGGFKIESWAAGVISDTGDIRPVKIGTGATWEKYIYSYTVAPGSTGIKFVPLWGPNSSVGYDNIGVDNTAVVPPTVVPVVPNGDFEIPAGANWSFFQGGGQTVSYPATGGNPNGCAVINSVGLGSYAVMVWNNNAPKSLTSLGLTAGNTYTFTQDMKILAPAVGTPGRSIGGIKVDFIPGSTGDIYPSQLIGDGTTWQTYSFQITIPLGVTQINVVPLWGPNSNVAFDNFKILLPAPPAPPQPGIAIGKMISWTPTVTTNTYQPQESVDGLAWANLGPYFTGTTYNSVFDATVVPFYRVQEGIPTVEEAAINTSFEDEFLGAASGWDLVQSQPPVLINTNAHSGTNSMQIKVVNLMSGAGANGSELQQNIFSAGGSVTPGKTYNFSFWAKQISSGASYEQRFKVSWLASGGGILGDGGFQGFSGAGGWEKKTQNGLVAPAGTASALIQILGVTGAVDGGFGEVIIDDVSLQTTGIGSTTTITSTATPSAEISWQSITGQSYQVRSSLSLGSWSPFGSVIVGNNTLVKVYDTPLVTRKFYQLGTQ